MEKVCSLKSSFQWSLSATLRYITLFHSYSRGKSLQSDWRMYFTYQFRQSHLSDFNLAQTYLQFYVVGSEYFECHTVLFFIFLFYSNKLLFEVAKLRKTSQVFSTLQPNCVIRSPFLLCRSRENISSSNVVTFFVTKNAWVKAYVSMCMDKTLTSFQQSYGNFYLICIWRETKFVVVFFSYLKQQNLLQRISLSPQSFGKVSTEKKRSIWRRNTKINVAMVKVNILCTTQCVGATMPLSSAYTHTNNMKKPEQVDKYEWETWRCN